MRWLCTGLSILVCPLFVLAACLHFWIMCFRGRGCGCLCRGLCLSEYFSHLLGRDSAFILPTARVCRWIGAARQWLLEWGGSVLSVLHDHSWPCTWPRTYGMYSHPHTYVHRTQRQESWLFVRLSVGVALAEVLDSGPSVLASSCRWSSRDSWPPVASVGTALSCPLCPIHMIRNNNIST